MSDFLGKSPDKGVGVKNANIVTERNTAKRVAFLLKFDVTKDFCGFFVAFGFTCCNGFIVLGCALWLSVLAFFDFQMLCYLTCDPCGVRSQKGKWLIGSELGGYKLALVDAW